MRLKCGRCVVESSASPRNPHSAVTANPVATLHRQAYTGLGTDFSPALDGILSDDAEGLLNV